MADLKKNDYPRLDEKIYPDETDQKDEKVVYPGHGVAIINRIIERRVAGQLARYFELKFLNKDMTILVPIENLDAIGIRKLSSIDKINDMFKVLTEPAKKISADTITANWNKRSKKYLSEVRTGNLIEICKIYRDLKHISYRKELSFGEKNLLSLIENMLAQEISLVKNMDEDKAIENLRALFTSNRNNILAGSL
jgi:CarD family transcriptional regulator